MSTKHPAPLEFEKPIIELEKMLKDLEAHTDTHSVECDSEVDALNKKLKKKRKEVYSNLTPWQRVQIVRHPNRPYTLDYISRIFKDFIEIHGDRIYGDDQALVGGFAKLGEQPVIVLGHQKGRDTKENVRRNFGCAHPEGYRKALRLMRLADKFKIPVICFIDTPGAYPGVASEERHVAEAIAVNIREMFKFKVPILAAVIGEGGSGGALGIGVADRIVILENAYYSVISPEGCASILWKDRAFAPKAAEALRLTADDLKKFGMVDEIIDEPQGGAQYNWGETATALKASLEKNLSELLKEKDTKKLLQQRYDRYRQYGRYSGDK
jgi:acetyl-CoA carboxylase carboxyl transferase subunit alpha